MVSLNLRYHALNGQKDGRKYIHDATTGGPVLPDYGNLNPDDAADLAAALNRENGCYVQVDGATFRLRLDAPAIVRIASRDALVCALPVDIPGDPDGWITVPTRDGVHIARFVGLGVAVYDPSDPAREDIAVLPPRAS